MGHDNPANDFKCYQCGETDAALAEYVSEESWFICVRCGENVITVRDLSEREQQRNEARIRKNLHVEEFLNARRVNKNPPA